jgi:hypothetical protein
MRFSNLTMKQFNNKTMENSFTILEVLVAAFLVTVGLTATLVLISKTLGQTSVSFSQLTAAYLSKEGIEIVRNIRDTNWVEGGTNRWNDELLNCSSGCIADYNHSYCPDPTDPNLPAYNNQYLKVDASGFYSYNPGGTTTKFKRKITIEQIPNDNLKVTVRVEWGIKGKNYSFTAQENLYRWR